MKKKHYGIIAFIIGSVLIPIICAVIPFFLDQIKQESSRNNTSSSIIDESEGSTDYQSSNPVFSNGDITSDKIELTKTNILYDGVCYKLYLPSEGNTFSMGSKTYSKGFVMYDDHSLFGEGDGYTLFDLGGKYSKISFIVGRTNEYEKQNVTLKVYLNGEYIEEYSLDAQSPPVYLEIDLKYANNLKLEITGGSRVKYGFADVILYY